MFAPFGRSWAPDTVLLSKRVNNYQCMFIADLSGESCMYPDLTWYPVRSMDRLSTSPVLG